MDLDQAVDHVYAPFTGPREIRIAVIEPSVDYDAPLQFSFQQALLEDLEGAYEAVSYVWGAPILTFPVYHTIDGSRICVTENLDKALRRRRHRLDRRCLWADAMCIDQRNDREKEIQIPLMVDIFRGAKRVLAWIHEGDEAIERGMRHIDRLSRQSSTHETYFEEDGTDHSVLQDVAAFINLPYFRRLWIVQEIVFSLDITLICGKSKLSWLRLSKGLIAFQRMSQSESFWPGDKFNGLKTVVNLWRRNAIMQDLDFSLPSRPHHEHIIDLVIKLSTYGCTDARDRIFAVHALSQQNHAGVAIDYSLDVYATYRRFALACMADDRMLAVLYAAAARFDTKSYANWPSWIPDWRRTPALIPDREGSSLIKYICEVKDDILELEVNYLLPETQIYERGDTQPLIVCTEEVVYMGKSLFAFSNAMIKLYEKSCQGDSSKAFISLLRFLDIFTSFGIEEGQLIELKSYLVLLWQLPGGYTGEMREHETWLEDPITELIEGYCCFTARFKGNTPTYFCFGRVAIHEGDILMATEMVEDESGPIMSHKMFRTLVLRPINPPGQKRPIVPQNACWTATSYQIIGEAWLEYLCHANISVFPYEGVGIYLC
jgi:hypothetical protein